jgi:hypothetical protein
MVMIILVFLRCKYKKINIKGAIIYNSKGKYKEKEKGKWLG